MHYPPETASIMLLVRILASIIQSNDPTALKAQLMQLCHRTINEEDDIAHKLLGEQFKGQLEKLRDLTNKAIGRPEISEVIILN
jgi:SET and MYND domain-containing protein 5